MTENYNLRSLVDAFSTRLFGRPHMSRQAAALPWRAVRKGVEVLLITSRGTGRWVLPKGWPEPGEELFETAAREAAEEAGLSGRVSSSEAGRYVYRKCMKSGIETSCEVFVYPLEVLHLNSEWRESDVRTRRWFTPEKAARMVQEPGLAELLSTHFRNRRDRAA